MKKTLLVILSLLFMYNVDAQQTPVIDRDLFFGNPEISGGQLSPDGKWISFMKQYEGIMNIWVKKFDEPFEKARPLTDSKRPLYGYFWTRDSKYILYVKDKDGDENINIFAVDPLAAADATIPESRNLTPMKDVTAQINLVSKKDNDLLYVGINDRDKAWHDLYTLKISTGELKKIYENTDRVTGFDFDWDENLRVMSKTDEKGKTTMFRVDAGNKLTPIYDFDVTEQAGITSWTPDNKQAYLITNKGDLDKSTLFLMDMETLKLTKVESDPENKVDFGGLLVDDNTRKIIGSVYTLDKTKYYWKDKKWEDMYNYLQKQFPGREVDFASHTKDYSKFLIAVGGDKYASEAYYFDVAAKKLIHQYTPRPKLKEVEKHLAAMTPVTYKSSDGLDIPAYLTLPVGSTGKNLPVVVLVHGGPKGPRDYWGYNPQAQFLANRGYAVLQPNFRASGGYGKKFLNAGDLQWGKLMQDDVTWGVKYLIEKGIADKNKVAIMGGSYGGYATLAGLAFTPDVYACGVDIVGPSNIFTLLESVPAYWESGRAFLHGMVGDPNTEEGKKRIQEASPLYSADKIVKPLLIIQGANDPRVKQAEADQIVIALREKGKKVAYLLAEDEGHGFAKPVNRMAMFAEIEKFLSETLGGRYQKEMPEDVAQRLKEISVDISKVTYAPKKALVMAKSLPANTAALKAGTYNYNVEIEVQGQKIPLTMTRTVSKKGNNWIIKDNSDSPMGSMTDETEYSPQYIALNRKTQQGTFSMPITYSAKAVDYEMQGNKLNIPFEDIYFTDATGVDMIIGGWPLQKGFELVTQVADLSSAKAKQVQISCTGEESVNGQSCYVVNMESTDNPNDKTTYYINPKTKMAEKIVAKLPSMGGATMTTIKK